MEIIKVTGLSCRYHDQENDIFTDVSLAVEDGSFVVISGASGSGKSTLLRMMKKELMPQCRTSGRVEYKGVEISKLDDAVSSSQIGFVMQNPHMQPVTDTVWHELVFGLENLGMDSGKIRKTAAETAGYFGLTEIYRKKISELSGGQKQLVNLASVMAMKPSVLLLDEPVSQLDPIAADNFISVVKKINHELGITVIIAEHHLDRIIDTADRLIVLKDGKKFFDDVPENICTIYDVGTFADAEWLPVPARVFAQTGGKGKCPLSVKELGSYIRENFKCTVSAFTPPDRQLSDERIIELRDIWFRYDRYSKDILRGLDIEIRKSEFLCILGGNGTGKTTFLGVIAGILNVYKGNIKINGRKSGKHILKDRQSVKCAYLPQNPQLIFAHDRLYDDLREICQSDEKISDISARFELTALLEKHPFDLSGGEQQKAALAKLLLTDPEIILLDEPTKGLDAEFRSETGKMLHTLCSEGKTVIMSTHDLEFAAQYADRCAMLFDGECACIDKTYDFFRDNDFYTTCSAAAVRGYYTDVLTGSDAVGMCLKNEKK